MSFTENLLQRTKQLSEQVNGIDFSFDGFVYNPLDYAWSLHESFLVRYVKENSPFMFLGMNPGPFGMLQTGVPFGEINAVKNYLKISGNVDKPTVFHASRPVLGLECKRSEVSGKRLWGLIESKYPCADAFADDICVFNYCPLGFLDKGKTAKNITPDHLAKEERTELEKICDSYLVDVVKLVKPKVLVGVGKYSQAKFEKLFSEQGFVISSVIHPSPGNPQANNGWAEKTSRKLKELGLWN